MIFTGYNSSELNWQKIDQFLGASRDNNPAWNIVGNFTEIEELDVQQLRDHRITLSEKSVFKYIIVLQRQPRTAIVYVILPTVAITIFNLLSLLLPSGEGFI